jgi:hypothetical protein
MRQPTEVRELDPQLKAWLWITGNEEAFMANPIRLFELVKGDFGPQFSFHALTYGQAVHKASRWCAYHSFDMDREQITVIPARKQHTSIHDEYIND